MRGTCPCRGPRCKLDAGDLLHGKRTGYAKHGCRCDDCTDAQADYMAEWQANNPDKAAANSARWYAKKTGLREARG